jgi:putative aldouronate transport system substrate-binding protein
MNNGKYEFISLPADISAKLLEEAPSFGYFSNNRLYAWTADDYANRIVMSGTQKTFTDSYALYKDIMTNEVWPRPYFTSEEAQRTNELRTDIFNTTTQMRGRWISGQADIDATWNEYKANLDRMGLQEYMSILQKAYDVFTASMK